MAKNKKYLLLVIFILASCSNKSNTNKKEIPNHSSDTVSSYNKINRLIKLVNSVNDNIDNKSNNNADTDKNVKLKSLTKKIKYCNYSQCIDTIINGVRLNKADYFIYDELFASNYKINTKKLNKRECHELINLKGLIIYNKNKTQFLYISPISSNVIIGYSKNKINSFGTYDTENISISTTNVCNIVSELPTFITKKKIKLGITENQFNIIMKNCPFIKKKKIKGVLYVIDFYDKLFNMKYEIEKNADTLFSDIYLYYGRYFFNGEKKLTEFSFGLHYP